MKLTYERADELHRGMRRKARNIYAPALLLLAIDTVSKARTQELRAHNTSKRFNPKRSFNATLALAVLNGDPDVHTEYKRLIKELSNVRKNNHSNKSPR